MRIRIGKIIRIKALSRTRLLLGAGLMVTLIGCVPLSGDRHLVLGIGVFHVERTNQVTVVEAKSIGIYAGDGRLNIGVSSIYAARVPTNANLILEVTR